VNQRRRADGEPWRRNARTRTRLDAQIVRVSSPAPVARGTVIGDGDAARGPPHSAAAASSSSFVPVELRRPARHPGARTSTMTRGLSSPSLLASWLHHDTLRHGRLVFTSLSLSLARETAPRRRFCERFPFSYRISPSSRRE